jgi:hypothetical protein
MAMKDTAMERARDRIESSVERAEDALATADERARTMIAARPVMALLCALGLGYVLGRVVSRL